MKSYIYSILFLSLVGQAYGQCFDPGIEIWSDTWRSCQISENPNPARDAGHWIMYDFGETYRLSKTHIWNTNEPGKSDMGFRNVIVDYSQDGETWTELGTYEFPQGTEEAVYGGFEGFDFSDSLAQYVLITAVDNWGHASCSGLAEVKFNLREPGDYTPAEAECTVPEETASFVLSHEIAYIIFEENPLAVEYFFEYRPVGGDWEEMEVEDGEVILFDLEPETTYEYVIYVECSDGTFLESQVFTFTTIAEQLACGTPITSDYFVTNVDDDIYFAFISCNFVPDATMYRMRFRLAGTADDWTVLEGEEPFFDIGFLEEGQEYEYQMSALCPNGWSDYTESFFFSTDEVTGTFTVQLGDVKFDLYPNPARDFVNVRVNSMEAAPTEVLISNLMGQTLYRQNFRLSVGPNTLTLPTDRLGAGIYFVSLVQQNKGVSSQRLIIVD